MRCFIIVNGFMHDDPGDGDMPQETGWYIENRVIHSHFYGLVTEEDLASSGEESDDLKKNAQQPLFLLIDVREVTIFPSNFKRLLERMRRYQENNPIAWTIVLSNNNLLNLFSLLVSRVLPTPFLIYKTLEEADAFISYAAPDLAPMLELCKEAGA